MPHLRSLCLALSFFLIAPAVGEAELLGAQQALSRVEKTPLSGNGQSVAAQLLHKVRDYRTNAAGLPASEAAKQWFVLYDEVGRIDKSASPTDFAAYDIETLQPVGVASMLTSLPPPPMWLALREAAGKRTQGHPNDAQALAVRLVTEILAHDRAAALATLRAIEDAAGKLDANERRPVGSQVSKERGWLATLYGARDEVADSFLARVNEVVEQHSQLAFANVSIPDLVGLVGETRATILLTRALRQPVAFRSEDGDATRDLVRRLALAQVQDLTRAQWGLVDTPEALPLYEALQKRFEVNATDSPIDERIGKQRADLMYLIGLIVAGRQDDAERQLKLVTRDSELELPKAVVASLHRRGQAEALFRFLHNLLERQPELKVWTIYLQEAAYSGHSKDALALIERQLARADLPDYLARALRFRRIAAQLATDQIEPAIVQIRALLSVPPSASDSALNELASLGVQSAGLGRLLAQPGLSTQGFAYSLNVLALDVTTKFNRNEIVTAIYAEMRKQNQTAQAEAVAIAELQRARTHSSGFEALAGVQGTAERSALTELAGIYDAAKRPQDVMLLLDDASGWGATDVVELLDTKDSLGAPLGLAAARALGAHGDTVKAIAVVRTLLDRLPGYDPAYEFFVDLAKDDAIAELDRRYASDRFEERPLIWKAVALEKAGRVAEAEAAARAAIAIDPSDGEEGPGDRMRAYAVLASALEAKGDITSAETYRGAVQAIRMSEQADELYKLGLYKRALKRYDEALAQFSDAYCIQSRLAVQLSKVGLNTEALAHYRRAYELMPESFGRVESHCFGCESVFDEPAAQNVAEQVFTTLVEKTPKNPQAHYMLGYLRQEQGRYSEALQSFRIAVRLDSEYLNAWRHLQELAAHTYIEPAERDIATLKLIELDPQQRHVHYVLNQVTDLRLLWMALDRVKLAPVPRVLYPLESSARAQAKAMAGLPDAARQQMEQYRAFMETWNGRATTVNARQGIAKHVLITSVKPLLGARARDDYEMPE